MTEEQVRGILLDWSDYEDEIKEETPHPFIVVILNNGDRIKGYMDLLSMSLGMLRMCDSFDLEDKEIRWYLIPVEEIRYIESTVAFPYTGSFENDPRRNNFSPESV